MSNNIIDYIITNLSIKGKNFKRYALKSIYLE